MSREIGGQTQYTVAEMIEILSRFKPNEYVGIRASCCSHPHGVKEIRTADNYEHDEADVVIDVR